MANSFNKTELSELRRSAKDFLREFFCLRYEDFQRIGWIAVLGMLDEDEQKRLPIHFSFGNEEHALAVKESAEKGNDNESMYFYAVYLLNGKVIDQNIPEAVHLLQKLTEQNYVPAVLLLACCYRNAVGHKQLGTKEPNRTKSLPLFKQAAKLGDVDGMYYLGRMFMETGSIRADAQYDKAVKWLTKSAAEGHIESMVSLGDIYREGWYNRGGPAVFSPDIAEAEKWYRKAAEMGHIVAKARLSFVCVLRSVVQTKAGHTIEETRFEEYKQAAEDGDALAQYRLGVVYYNGIGTVIDKEEAVKWWQAGAKQKNSDALCGLAACYFAGEGGLPQDYKGAVKLLNRALWGGWANKDAEIFIEVCQLNEFDGKKNVIDVIDAALFFAKKCRELE